MKMDAKYLAEIKARTVAATPRPWHHDKDCLDYIRDANGLNVCMIYQRKDATFLAHARTDIPALLDEVERLNRLMAEAKENQLDPVEMAKVGMALKRGLELQAENATLKKALELSIEAHDTDAEKVKRLVQYYTQRAKFCLTRQEQEGKE